MPAGGAGSVGIGTAWTFRRIVPGGDSMVTRSSSAPLRSMSAAATTVTRLVHARGRTCWRRRRRALVRRRGDGPGMMPMARATPAAIHRDSTMAINRRGTGRRVKARFGFRRRARRGRGRWLGCRLHGRLRSGRRCRLGVGACVGSGVGACEGSGLASGGRLSCCRSRAAGSWAATGAGTMMALASSSAACRRTMPLKGARPRRGGCVTSNSLSTQWPEPAASITEMHVWDRPATTGGTHSREPVDRPSGSTAHTREHDPPGS